MTLRFIGSITSVLIAGTVLATACGGEGASGPVASAPEQLVDEFETIDGETFDLASLQGEDVVLWFWAPW